MNADYMFIVSGTESPNENYSKGIFEEVLQQAKSQIEISAKEVAINLKKFCENFCDALPKIEGSDYELEEVEVNAELTASGEVKLIGGVSTGVAGGISLKFVKKK